MNAVTLAADDAPEPPRHDRGYDVLRYELNLRLDPEAKYVTGSVGIRLSAVNQALERVLLDLVQEMTCTRCALQGEDLIFTHHGDSLLITLPSVLPAGETLTLDVNWEGKPKRHGELYAGLMFRTHDAGTIEDNSDDVPIIATVSQPWSAHSWWPCKDNPTDKALVGLSITVPDALRTVANGVLMSDSPAEPGWQRTHWEETYPIATYLVALAVSNYETWTEDCFVTNADPPDRPVLLEFHFLPMDRAEAEYDLAHTCQMMEFMTNLAGPYPFVGEKYAQVETTLAVAMENQTMTGLPRYMIRGDRHFETIVLHELAHHWYGNSLTPAAWADIWLNEGFARYCEALWVEEMQGRTAYDEFMRECGPERHETLFVGEGTLADPDPILPNFLVYDKGAWVLHMLRLMIGDAAFFEFMREYATDPELVLGSVTTADMIAVAEQCGGRDLGGFFGPWLETDQLPEVTATPRVIENGSSQGQVEVRLRQEQEVVFEMPVPVAVHFQDELRIYTARLTQREQVFTFTVPGAVDSVTIDPEGMALLRSAIIPEPTLAVTGPIPNPVGPEGGRFEIFLTQQAEVVARTFDARGRLLLVQPLGLLAATGRHGDPLTTPHTMEWLSNSRAGETPLPASGVYWIEFRAGEFRIVKKAVLLK